MLKSFNNWTKIPKMISFCFSMFCLFYVVLIELDMMPNDLHTVWVSCFILGALAFVVFHSLNRQLELKKISGCASSKEANDKMESIYQKFQAECMDDSTKKFIAGELSYVKDPIKRYIFIRDVYAKIPELNKIFLKEQEEKK